MNPWAEVFQDFNLILLLFSIGGFCATAGSLISDYQERRHRLKGGEKDE